jgi:predicted nucleotidyltransferase
MKVESPGGTTGVEENPIWERYRESWREREARRRAEAEARRAAAERAIQAVTPRYPGIRRVYLFGSVLRPGAFRPDSDIDVGVEGDDGHGLFDFWRELEAAAPG